MKFTDLNPAEGIGSNCYLLEIGPFRIVVDAGMNPKEVGSAAIPSFGHLDGHELDLILLTHCHLDHLGTLPIVWRKFPQTPILCSRPSEILAPRMLRNSCTVMRRQRDELRIPEYPLYTYPEVEALGDHLQGIQFNRPFHLAKGDEELTVTLHPAGHIPGAAGATIEYKHRRIFITGDVLFRDQCILDGAEFPTEPCDTLIMETTHGIKVREEEYSREREADNLLQGINDTLENNGTVLIPVFALGRMQEVLTILNNARRERRLTKCPIFCSGLGLDLIDYFDTISRKTGLVHFRRTVLKELEAKPLRYSFTPGKAPQRGIYVVSSGMMVENTPSYAIAAALLDHPRNSIFFVGYCDPLTPGGQLLHAPKGAPFLFDALDYQAEIHARVEKFDFSGHADRNELMDYALLRDPRTIVLTHGDAPAREWFENSFAEVAPKLKVHNPKHLTTIEV